MQLKKILWADDGSKISDSALNLSIYLSEIFSSRLYGIHVSSVPYPITHHYSYYAHIIEGVVKEEKKKFQKKYSSIKESLSKKKIKFSGVIKRGLRDDSIIEYSDSIRSDLIVMGYSSMGIISRMLIGSTTLKVLRKSMVPVLAVKDPKSMKKINMKKILVAIDLLDKSQSTLKIALDLAIRTKASVTAIYVISVDAERYKFPKKLVDEIITNSRDELSVFVKNIKNKDPEYSKINTYTKVYRTFNTALKITDYAKRNDFDLIVINKSNKSHIRKFVLGSVSEMVIQETPCSVLTTSS